VKALRFVKCKQHPLGSGEQVGQWQHCPLCFDSRGSDIEQQRELGCGKTQNSSATLLASSLFRALWSLPVKGKKAGG